jgi:hypothetical protein
LLACDALAVPLLRLFRTLVMGMLVLAIGKPVLASCATCTR